MVGWWQLWPTLASQPRFPTHCMLTQSVVIHLLDISSFVLLIIPLPVSNRCTLRHQQNRGYGILLLCAQCSHGLVISAMGQIPCSTERISCLILKLA